MRFANRTELERLRSEYPVGCRIVLDEMDDPYRQMPAGLQGVCRGVDDAGNILASWDNGSTLSVAYGADKCHRVVSEVEVKESLLLFLDFGEGVVAPTAQPVFLVADFLNVVGVEFVFFFKLCDALLDAFFDFGVVLLLHGVFPPCVVCVFLSVSVYSL